MRLTYNDLLGEFAGLLWLKFDLKFILSMAISSGLLVLLVICLEVSRAVIWFYHSSLFPFGKHPIHP